MHAVLLSVLICDVVLGTSFNKCLTSALVYSDESVSEFKEFWCVFYYVLYAA